VGVPRVLEGLDKVDGRTGPYSARRLVLRAGLVPARAVVCVHGLLQVGVAVRGEVVDRVVLRAHGLVAFGLEATQELAVDGHEERTGGHKVVRAVGQAGDHVGARVVDKVRVSKAVATLAHDLEVGLEARVKAGGKA
jgi:hypothetical protein